MRISTSWAQQLGVKAMLNQQATVSKTQMQLSSGKKNITSADDPIVASKTLAFETEIKKTDQYQRNIDTARARNSLEETALISAEDVMFRAKELAVQAANATLNENDRLAIKAEVDQLQKNLVGIANTRNANNEYIFSGDLSRVPAVKLNPVSNDYDYTGGVTQRVIAISPDRQVADGEMASTVFFNINSDSFEANATESGKQSVFKTLQQLSDALAGAYKTPEANLTGTRFARYGADYSVNNSSFNLTADNTNTANITLDQDYKDIDTLVTAVNTQIQTQGFAGDMQARKNGNMVEFVSLTQGEQSSIQIDTVNGTFLTDIGLTTGQVSVGSDLDGFGSINGGQSLAAGGNYLPPQNSGFELAVDGGVAVNIALNQSYPDLNSIVTDINNQLSAAGVSTKMEAAANGNVLSFKSLTETADSFIQIKAQTGNFLQDAGFDNLQSGKGLEQAQLFDGAMANVITDLGTSLDSILEARTRVGSRLRAMDDQYALHDSLKLNMQTALSTIQDLDYTEAISRFEMESLVLQAAQQSFAKVQNLSLFNFL